MFPKLKSNNCRIAFFSSAFQAFGIYNVHATADVTEGGVLGATLLLQHWFDISPAISSFILNAICFGLGLKILGKTFIAYSPMACHCGPSPRRCPGWCALYRHRRRSLCPGRRRHNRR